MKNIKIIIPVLLLLLFSFSVVAQEFPLATFIEPMSEQEKNKKRIIGEANFEKI